MNNEGPFSDEYLNAFVDDQLALDEKGRLYIEINKDEAMNRRICELRKVRDLVQMAYKNPPNPAGSPDRAGHAGDRHRRFLRGAAAVVGVVVLVGGLQRGSTSNIGHWGGSARVALVAPASPATRPEHAGQMVASAATPASQVIKVLFNLNSGNPAHMKEVLDETRNLLNLYQRTHQKARVEVIANGEGLNLLLAARSPYPDMVSAMLKHYKNLQFAACLNTLNRFGGEGIDTKLLPGTTIIDSGVAQIIRLQQKGWIYVQV